MNLEKIQFLIEIGLTQYLTLPDLLKLRRTNKGLVGLVGFSGILEWGGDARSRKIRFNEFYLGVIRYQDKLIRFHAIGSQTEDEMDRIYKYLGLGEPWWIDYEISCIKRRIILEEDFSRTERGKQLFRAHLNNLAKIRVN